MVWRVIYYWWDAGLQFWLLVSRAVFAVYLRTNVAHWNWEQGRAKPNAQAAPLPILLSVTDLNPWRMC